MDRRPSEVLQAVLENVEKVVVGKRTELELTIVALAGQGHVLIEDVPGVGKTVMAKSLARSLGCSFKRIQFTPDLLPSDVTGVSIYNQRSEEFEFRPGPVVAQVVLADEINRATPKTQAALLEAMEEQQITVDGTTHDLPRPFIVLATQNPIEYEGTFPLPESQLDRFMLRVRLGYPKRDEEMSILERQQHVHPVESLEAVTSEAELLGGPEGGSRSDGRRPDPSLHRGSGQRDAQPPGGVRRGEPTGGAVVDAGGTRSGAAQRPRLRPAGRRQGARHRGALTPGDRAAVSAGQGRVGHLDRRRADDERPRSREPRRRLKSIPLWRRRELL